MNIEYIDNENYEATLAFLGKENQNISDWCSPLKDALFKLCVVNADNEIQCVFIFEDYPQSLQNKHEFISETNWENWLKNYFEVPYETYHTLWLCKWCVLSTFDIDTLRFIFSSLFISNHEIEAILLSVDVSTKNDESPFEMLFNPLHRIHRNTNDENSNDESLKDEITLLCCSSSKILPNIEIRKATVEDFDDLMPLFQENSSYLQQKHGEFFLAEIIESAQTLIAVCNQKPVGFGCFTTNIDLMSLRNAFYLEQFDDFQKIKNISSETTENIESTNSNVYAIAQKNVEFAQNIAQDIMKYYSEKEWISEQEQLTKQFPENDENYLGFIKSAFGSLEENKAIELEKYVNDKVTEYKKMGANHDMDTQKPPKLTIDTSSLSTFDDNQNQEEDPIIVVINLLCIDSNYIYVTKIFAQTIFNYYPECQYLLATTPHNEPTAHYFQYFSRVYPKPCVEYPYNLYLCDKNAIHAMVSVRSVNWKLDIEQLKQVIDASVPEREKYLSDVYDCYVAVVDYKIIGAIYISKITSKQISEYSTFYDMLPVIKDIHNVKVTNTAILEFMSLNPIFNVNVKGILKEIMRKTQISTLFYHYSSVEALPEPQSAVMESFVQLKPKHFVYSTSPIDTSYALYTFCREFYAKTQEIINHRIVIIGNTYNDDCSYGFIQYLLTQTDLKFTNVTLIDTSSYSNTHNKTDTSLFRSNIMTNSNNVDYVQKLCVDNKIEIVRDAISELDINRKSIHLQDSGVCLYDILIFANGLGPVHIIPSNKDHPFDKAFDNVLLVSPEIHENIQKLENYVHNNGDMLQENIVLYGDSINMFCIINHLVTKCKIDGNKIIMVKCLSSTSSEFYFKNDKLKEIIERQIKDLGIKVLENVIPVGFVSNKVNPDFIEAIQFIQNENQEINAVIINEKEDDEKDDKTTNDEGIHAIKLTLNDNADSKHPYYSLSAQLVILCQNEIDINTLEITNQYPFVIDGQIVIDNEFRTQDPTIYAVGSIAKLSRKFLHHNNSVSWFQYTNSFDLGIQCADKVVDHILNGNHKRNEELNTNADKETCVVATFNGGYTYFYAYNPRFAMRNTEPKGIQHFESCTDNEFSSIVLDSFGHLREILYYGRQWKSEWKRCGSLINIHCAFLSSVENYFNKNEENEFLNICEVLNKEQYQIMCDDRFKDWMQTVRQNNKAENVQMKNDVQSLIKRIVNVNVNEA